MQVKTPAGELTLADSTRTLAGEKQFTKFFTSNEGVESSLKISIKWNDSCKNGHNTFGVTATLYEHHNGRMREVAGGMLQEEIALRAPELAYALPYHLVSADGPMYYFVNTTFLAGTRDCWGYEAGEPRHSKNVKLWRLAEVPYATSASEHPPEPYVVEFEPVLSQGKTRDFAAVRRILDWPDASIEAMSLPEPELRARILEARPAASPLDVTNALYYASDKADGFAKGEQARNAQGELKWKATKSPFTYVAAPVRPAPLVLQYGPVLGEGKVRELELARKAAHWPDATDEQLCLPTEQLEKLLAARLPAFMTEFKTVVESFGFTY